jgi:flagellar L-ring protein precursor FlgH
MKSNKYAQAGTRMVSALAALALAGCVTPSSIVQQPTSAVPVASAPVPAANGAIFQAASYRPLFEDRIARHVGDVLTIDILEKTNAGKQASSNAAKKGSVNSSIPTITKFPFNWLQGLDVAASSKVDYEDESKVNSGNNFTGSITVTVTDVLANGNLVVSGEKQVGLDKVTEYVRLSGVVRPDSITAGNRVASSQVADARIEYRTSSLVDSAEVASWMARFFLSFLPL